jgi:preprotein translocase subunit SecA
MTGTAMTEANEFAQIYKLGVVPIPTNKPMIRLDSTDVVYQTVQAKFEAVVEDIAERHAKGQPVLVGTISVEKSEILSRMLKRHGVPHEVLNAKYHEREATIVAQAGRKGGVTVATNMAGRGTDIMLGGNPDFLADVELHQRGLSPVDTPEDYEAAWSEAVEKAKAAVAEEHAEVVEAGGLYVLGTERHESRRIDLQLRGRSGRQGDPGESRFYLSLEDDLMRMFNADKVAHFMEWLKTPPDVPIESKAVTRSIRSAQTQFEIRKDVLKYDDVLNRQRKVVYSERRRVLEGADLHEQIRQMIDEVIEGYVAGATSEGFAEEWDLDTLWTALQALYHPKFTVAEAVEEAGGEQGMDAETLAEVIRANAQESYDQREEELTPEIMRELERRVVLAVLDRKWREHLYEMDYLREGIGLRAWAQRDPLVEYQREGFDMFNAMMEGIKEESVGNLFNLQVEVQENPIVEEADGPAPLAVPGPRAAGGAPAAQPANSTGTVPGSQKNQPRSRAAGRSRAAARSGNGQNGNGQNGNGQGGNGQRGAHAAPAGDAAPPVVAPGLQRPQRPARLQYSAPSADEPGQVEQHASTSAEGDQFSRVGRNDLCPCGSGRKYKRCHGDPRNRAGA